MVPTFLPPQSTKVPWPGRSSWSRVSRGPARLFLSQEQHSPSLHELRDSYTVPPSKVASQDFWLRAAPDVRQNGWWHLRFFLMECRFLFHHLEEKDWNSVSQTRTDKESPRPRCFSGRRVTSEPLSMTGPAVQVERGKGTRLLVTAHCHPRWLRSRSPL